MNRNLALLALAPLAGIVVTGCGGQRGPATPTILSAATAPAASTITTQGTGTVVGRPDQARVEIGVSTTAPHTAEALQQNNTLATAVQAALSQDGVADKDMATTGLSLGENYPGPGFRVYDGVTATIRDLGRAGRVIDDALAAAGDAGRLEFVDLSLSDTDPAVATARQQAVAAAKAQAEQMAAAAGVSLGGLLSLSDQPQGGPSYGYGVAASAGAAGAPDVPIQAGTRNVTVTVTAVWRIG